MPGVPHPRHDGFATAINNMRTGIANLGQQQAFPGFLSGTGPYSIVSNIPQEALPSPGPLTTNFNASASLTFLVTLSAVVEIPLTLSIASTEFQGSIGFTVNGSPPGTGYNPITFDYTPPNTGTTSLLSLTLSGVWVISNQTAGTLPQENGIPCTSITVGQNTFEVVAWAIDGTFSTKNVILVATPL